MKYKVALFIGRFQPFHKGHLFSLNKCFEIAEKVIVGIGSSGESGTENNPWDFETRKKMVESVLRGSSSQVVAIPDYESDEVWLKETIERAGKFDVVVSNNDWVTELMKGAGYAIYETGLLNRDELEGVKIRELMRKGDRSWESRVPICVAEIINNQIPIIK
jgi:nicotinamide-nucleotide adenylyltransferase